jgi:protein SCO1/2
MKKLKVLVILISITFMSNILADAKWPPMSLFHLESTWINHNSKEIKMENLSGRPSIIAMVYTSCEHTCPMIIAKLIEIQKSIKEKERKNINLVLVSFDPDADTPKALSAYKKQRVLSDEWSLFTGKKTAIRSLAAILGVSYKEISKGVFSHSNVITLLNKNGEIISQIRELNEDIEDMSIKVKKLLK